MPQAQLGSAQMGGPQPAGPGFGMGQQLMQGQMGQPGGVQMAEPQTIMGQLQASMGGMTPEQQQMMIQKLGPMAAQMMQGQQANQQQQMMPTMNMQQRQMQQPQTQASRGYLAQGGGIAPRQIVNKGY